MRTATTAAPQTTQQLLTKLVPKESNSRAKILAKDKNTGRLFIKFFLFDDSPNGAKWGVTSDKASIIRNLEESYRGKPIVLYKDSGLEPDRTWYQRMAGFLNHPPWDDADVNHSLAMQEPFRVGDHLDYVNHGSTWWGIGEITDEGTKKFFNENPTAPFYTSSALRQKHLNQDPAKMKDWWFMHTAIVSVPAWGFQKAYVKSRCSGEEGNCLLKLKTASLVQNQKEGKPSCGFCTYQAMKDVSQHAKDGVKFPPPINDDTLAASKLIKKLEDGKENEVETKNESGTTDQTNQTVSSHLQISANFPLRQSLSDNSTTTTPQGETATTFSYNVGAATADSNANSNNPQTIHVETQTVPQPSQTQATIAPNPVAPVQELRTRPAQKFVNLAVENAGADNTANTANTSNNNTGSGSVSNSITAQKDKLIELLADNERKRNQLIESQKQISSLQTERDRVVQVHASDSSRIKRLEEWIAQKKAEEDFRKVADAVFDATLYDTHSDEERINEAKNWLNTKLPADQILERIGSLEQKHKQAIENMQKKFAEETSNNVSKNNNSSPQQAPQSNRVALAGMSSGNTSTVVSATKTASMPLDEVAAQSAARRSGRKPMSYAINEMLFHDAGGLT